MEFGQVQQAARNANSVLQLARQERIAAEQRLLAAQFEAKLAELQLKWLAG